MNKGKSKNAIRIVAVILLLLAAAALAFFVLPNMYSIEGATTEIIMLRQPVSKGTMIESNMLATVSVGAYGLDPSVLKTTDGIVGKYAAQDISNKDLLFASKFEDKDPLRNEVVNEADVELADDQMLVTLALSSTAAGAAGHILPGDLVNVAVYRKADNMSGGFGSIVGDSDSSFDKVIFPEILQAMTVLRVQTTDLTPIDPSGESSVSSNNSRVPVYITLVCTQEQAELLLEHSYENTLHFVEVE